MNYALYHSLYYRNICTEKHLHSVCKKYIGNRYTARSFPFQRFLTVCEPVSLVFKGGKNEYNPISELMIYEQEKS